MSTRSTAPAIALALVVLAAAGCGDQFTDDEAVQVQLETIGPDGQTSNSAGVSIGEQCPAHKQSEPGTIRFLNTGEAQLKIESIATKKLPDRVLFRGKETGSTCTFGPRTIPSNDKNGDCGPNAYCEGGAAPNDCVSTQLPSTPITVGTESSYEFEFFLSAANVESGEASLNCPSPGNGVPDDYREDYCGHVRFETNAQKNTNQFSEGNVTVYLQVEDDRSGVIELLSNSMTFSNLEAGGPEKTGQFTVRNNAPEESLEVTGLQVDKQPNLLSVSPSTPVTVEADSDQVFDVTAQIPDGYDLSTLQELDFINVTSSAVNRCGSVPVTIRLRTATSGGPAIALDKSALSFKSSSTQTVTVENVGTSTLLLNGTAFDPQSTSSKYSVSYLESAGANEQSLQGQQIQPGNSGLIKIEFTDSTGGVAEMRLNHNDSAVGGQSSIMLLGAEDGGLGEFAPPAATFNFGTQATRKFVVWNRGTGPLELNPQLKDPQDPNAPVKSSNFTVNGFKSASPIAAGEYAIGTIEFDGTSGDQKTQLLLEMQSNTVGDPLEIPITVTEKPSSKTLEAKIKALFDDKTVEVGQTAKFNSSPSMGNSSTSGDFWYLLERPSSSTFYNSATGDSFAVRPDVAGQYIIGFTAVESTANGTLQDQTTFTLTAEPESSN